MTNIFTDFRSPIFAAFFSVCLLVLGMESPPWLRKWVALIVQFIDQEYAGRALDPSRPIGRSAQ